MLTKEYVDSVLEYDSTSGVFIWKRDNDNHFHHKGKIAGRVNKDGRVQIKINGNMYSAHRLVFLLENGAFPELDVDHVDGNPLNNSRSNLRLATKQQNRYNTKLAKNNKLGVKGVHLTRLNRFSVAVSINGVQEYLGTYATLEEATAVAESNRNKYHGEFVRHK